MGIKTLNKIKPIAIVYSDIHHHIYSQYNQDNKRLKASMNIEAEIFDKAKELNVPVIFAGDLIHNEEVITNNLFYDLIPHLSKLNSKGVKWYGIDGNHDQVNINTFEKRSKNYITPICKAFKNFNYIGFKSKDIGSVTLHGIPYITHDKDMFKLVKKIKTNKNKNILILHTTLPSSQDTNGRLIQTHTITKKFLKYVSKKFDLVLCGHIHKPMKIMDNVYQLGATNQQRKTDKDCKMGYWIIGNDLKLHFIQSKAPVFIELDEGVKPYNDFDYFYTKVEKKAEEDIFQDTVKYSDTRNIKKIAKTYLKDKGIKDIYKKQFLIKILKENHD